MNRRHVSLFALLALGVVTTSLHAQTPIKPAIVYSNGGKFDKSFNEGVSKGAQRFTAETGIAVADFEPSHETQFEQADRRFAQRGQDPIIAVSFSQATALEKVAKEFPKTRFTIIDSVVALPNVQSVVFKFSRTGDVTLRAFVVPATSYFKGFGPSSLPVTPTGTPATPSASGTTGAPAAGSSDSDNSDSGTSDSGSSDSHGDTVTPTDAASASASPQG